MSGTPHDILLMVHFIGLAMGVGTGIGFLFFGIEAGKMEPAKRAPFLLSLHPLARMGQIGLLVLVLSGGALMTPHWSRLGDMPLMIAKLVLVLVLGAVIGINSGYMRKARAGNLEVMSRIPAMGRVALLTSITIVVLATLVFH